MYSKIDGIIFSHSEHVYMQENITIMKTSGYKFRQKLIQDISKDLLRYPELIYVTLLEILV